MANRILVVDDEKEIADLVEVYLENEGYEVCKCYTAREALACIRGTSLDLAVLDLMLPGMDGYELCRRIRDQGENYPVIMLTARDGETDKITGLTLGADDYLTKPFRPLELVARVKAQLRRYQRYNPAQAQGGGGILTCGELEMDVRAHQCALRGRALNLTPTEFAILRTLLERKGEVVSARELFQSVWGNEVYYARSNSTITVHIRHLREKLGEGAEAPNYIKTVWGCGYKIEE